MQRAARGQPLARSGQPLACSGQPLAKFSQTLAEQNVLIAVTFRLQKKTRSKKHNG